MGRLATESRRGGVVWGCWGWREGTRQAAADIHSKGSNEEGRETGWESSLDERCGGRWRGGERERSGESRSW